MHFKAQTPKHRFRRPVTQLPHMALQISRPRHSGQIQTQIQTQTQTVQKQKKTGRHPAHTETRMLEKARAPFPRNRIATSVKMTRNLTTVQTGQIHHTDKNTPLVKTVRILVENMET